MKGYKAFNKDWTCRGFQYEIGESYELPEGEKPKMCQRGFHFCENPIDIFGYYNMDDNTVIGVVEAYGAILREGTKLCTDKIRIIREFTREELKTLIRDGSYNSGSYNSGSCNSGDYNSGNRNSGSYNSGDYNSGNRNSGSCNSGSCNSGDYNSGSCNSGDYNSGDYNSGDYNSGSCNSGDYNSGDYNSGDYNSGDYNSGDYNSGDYNSGDYNSGNYNSGIFNTDEPFMRAFNRPTTITRSKFLDSLTYSWLALLGAIAKKELTDDDWSHIRNLPNYNADIFEEITGIKDPERRGE